MIEDKATEKLKKRLKDMGLIVNVGADNKTTTGTEKRATARNGTAPIKKPNGKK